ncbi:MAG: hypothetical protein AUH35_03030 [Nitrospirae bacterium 13_1_40CM_62_7]|nr:MAG: hypothetical protein AUH35_03030 [Nitrospirae bacterium 13_1_40CM_62_7]
MSQPSEQERLHELAERFGIAADYEDNWGRRHLASDRTKRAILAAMGVCAETEDEVRRELAACADAPWLHACDPVLLDGGDGVQMLQLRLCECTACLGVGHETDGGEREEC